MLKQLLAKLSTPETRQFLRFVVVGVVNTGAGYLFYLGFLKLGLPYVIAGTISYICGICFNYVTAKLFVFEKTTKKNPFKYYLMSYGILYFYGMAMLWLLVDVFHLTPDLAGLVALPINALVSFALLRLIVFR